MDFKRSSDRWIGLEVERLGVRRGTYDRLNYQEDLKPLLQDLIAQKGWRIEYEVDNQPLAIQRNLHQISLEPGSQFEVSLAPRSRIQDVVEAQNQIDQEIRSLKSGADFAWLGVGTNPWDLAEQRPLLPSPRYRLMDQYFLANHGRGREMMRLTCGLQINLDFSTEAEGIEMLRAGFLLMPFLASLFSHSPYLAGKTSGALSERHMIWRVTDALRSQFVDFVFDSDFGLRRWAQMAAEVPLMYAYDVSGDVIDPQGAALKDLAPSLHQKNALSALRQIFTEVRYKPCCVELRSFDQVPPDLRYAATAFCVGLLYHDKARASILQSLKSFASAKKLSDLMEVGAREGLRNDEIYSELCKLVDLAANGLSARGFHEEAFLSPATQLLKHRKTPAEKWMEQGGNHLQNKSWFEAIAE